MLVLGELRGSSDGDVNGVNRLFHVLISLLYSRTACILMMIVLTDSVPDCHGIDQWLR